MFGHSFTNSNLVTISDKVYNTLLCKNIVLRGGSLRLPYPVVVISLFSIAVFTPAVNSPTTGVIGQNINYFAANSRNMQAVFNVGVECIYLAEPVNGNISKMQSSSKDIIPLFYASSGFYADKLFRGNIYIFQTIYRVNLSGRSVWFLTSHLLSFSRLACLFLI